jgi:hypothetical protein
MYLSMDKTPIKAKLKQKRFRIPIDQVAKPESPFWATGPTISLIRTAGKVTHSEVYVGFFMPS